MTSREQGRAMVLVQVAGGALTVADAAALLSLSERQVWRLRAGFERDGPAALVHANRGRPSPGRLPDATRDRILGLASGRYADINDTHLAELLAEREGIMIGRSSLQRLLRAAGRPSPRRRRAPRHRSRRDRMPAEGLLLQLDGSRHDWLGDRGPRLTLVGAVDDATGALVAATFREQEDAAGYLVVLRDTVRRHGIPAAVYRDRHSIFETSDRGLLTLEEQLVDRRLPTQVGRAFDELGITSIAAGSPQAKGRVERAWGTLQDRLVIELGRRQASLDHHQVGPPTHLTCRSHVRSGIVEEDDLGTPEVRCLLDRLECRPHRLREAGLMARELEGDPAKAPADVERGAEDPAPVDRDRVGQQCDRGSG